MSQRPTLAQLAEISHVSVSTASKALNGTGRISAQTRRIVQLNAEKLGYTTKRTSQTSDRTGLVGLITSDLNGRFALPLLTGVEEALGAAHHTALLMSSHKSYELEKQHIAQLTSRGIDGLIVVGDSTNPRPPIDPRILGGLPTVYAYAPSTDANDCSIVCDNVGAGRQAIEYLIGIGRSAIAIVGGGENYQAAKDRITGAQSAFSLYGLQPIRIINDRWSEEWGERAAGLLLADHPEVDAIYCLSDEIARGMIIGLMHHGKTVPGDIAVLGHDNWEVYSTGTHPTLTTFDNNIQLVGKTAADYLFQALHGKPYQGTISVECPMIIRESTDVGITTRLYGSSWYNGFEE
ncbi:LacI family DNA-binding transcriptional regulator [Alloscardovia criceti]|uniref:LacI family DNA-binding transcriptional regulator n=1 Tax=Alloscardovia criceti TaxID=356828 RepID=UPI00035D6B22|nr:LacI family DNA-binding transcriptional regulator [Alloscardovia criceti]